MSMTVQKRFGDSLITKSAEGTDMECMAELSFFSQLPSTCTNCNSTNVGLNHRNAKGYDFYGIKCLKCGAEARFGQYKTGGFFIKDGGKFSVYKGKGADEGGESVDPFGV